MYISCVPTFYTLSPLGRIKNDSRAVRGLCGKGEETTTKIQISSYKQLQGFKYGIGYIVSVVTVVCSAR